MQIKRYEAVNMHDALQKIKTELGPDAIVLSTKRMPGEKKLIEIMAARDDNQGREGTARGNLQEGWGEKASSFEDREIFGYLRKELSELKNLVRGVRREDLSEELADLKGDLQALFDILGMHGSSEEKDALSRIYHYLVGRGVSKARASKLLEEMKHDASQQGTYDYKYGLKIAENLIKRTFTHSISEQKKRVKVLVGPTGVGKTTTLAKLAARYAWGQKKTVGLITMDTYRIAAVDQLKVYARIMGLPLEVAEGKEGFWHAVERFNGKDMILVDTPGKSRSDGDYVLKLQEILKGPADVEASLLLSPTSSRENLLDVVGRFGNFPCDSIILTKVDESTRSGHIYDVLEKSGRPVTYVTTGQNVPQDIEMANPAKLAELIMWH